MKRSVVCQIRNRRSYASIDGNLISFSEPIRETHPKTVFHELGHIPHWQNGTLTTPKYVKEAIRSALRYVAKEAPTAINTYSMYASTKPPRDPKDVIWEDIPYEKDAERYGDRLYKAWLALGKDRPK